MGLNCKWATSRVFTLVFDKNAAQSACVKNWEFRRHSHCKYTVAHSKTIECDRMTMASHSSYIMRRPCVVSGGNIPAGLRLKGGNRRFPTNVCPSRRRVATATGKSTGSLKGDRPRWRSHRCERSKISNLHRHEVPWYTNHYQRRWRSHRSLSARLQNFVRRACEKPWFRTDRPSIGFDTRLAASMRLRWISTRLEFIIQP